MSEYREHLKREAEDKLKIAVASRGDVLITSYQAAHTKVEILCSEGHKFLINPCTL